MKLLMECKAHGLVFIEKQISVTDGQIEYLLVPDEKGWLAFVRIIKKVPNPEKYSLKVEPGQGSIAAKFVINGDRQEYLELVREFQEIESLLSFAGNGSLRNIEWDKPREEYIPETEEEKKQVGILSFHLTKEYPKIPSRLGEKDFNSLIKTKKYYKSLIIPKAFFKEGINEFESHRYINAFYNFYFVLEDNFGNGKWRNKEIAAEFKASTDLRKHIEWMVKCQIDGRHRESIQKFCKEEGLTYDVDGLIDLIVRARGQLHHYSRKSSKSIGTPFTHEAFESIAFFVMGLAVQTILGEILKINNSQTGPNPK